VKKGKRTANLSLLQRRMPHPKDFLRGIKEVGCLGRWPIRQYCADFRKCAKAYKQGLPEVFRSGEIGGKVRREENRFEGYSTSRETTGSWFDPPSSEDRCPFFLSAVTEASPEGLNKRHTRASSRQPECLESAPRRFGHRLCRLPWSQCSLGRGI